MNVFREGRVQVMIFLLCDVDLSDYSIYWMMSLYYNSHCRKYWIWVVGSNLSYYLSVIV